MLTRAGNMARVADADFRAAEYGIVKLKLIFPKVKINIM